MALRIVYKDFNLSVQELLIDNNSLNIHHRNLEKLVTKFFKVKNALSPKLINYIFEVIQKKKHTNNFSSNISGRGRSVQQNMA